MIRQVPVFTNIPETWVHIGRQKKPTIQNWPRQVKTILAYITSLKSANEKILKDPRLLADVFGVLALMDFTIHIICWQGNKLDLKTYIRYLLSNFYFFYQMIALQKLWKVFFISSKKLFPFSRYSNFYNFFPFFPHFPDKKKIRKWNNL